MATQTVLCEEHVLAVRTGPTNSERSGAVNTTPDADTPLSELEPETAEIRLSRFRQAVLVLHLSGVNLLTSSVNGLITVGLPRIAADVGLPPELYLWPASVYGLATGSALLLAGAVADVLGPRGVDLAGCAGIALFILGAGLARTGPQLVGCRAAQGAAAALHLAASAALVSAAVPRGRARNVAFSCLGLSQPLGFSVGLVVGGVLVDTAGWRAAWFLAGGGALLLAAAGPWALPRAVTPRARRSVRDDLVSKVDWVGAGIASVFMTTLSYLLAIISADVHRIREAPSIVLLCLSAVAVPCFVVWVQRQVKAGKPALIPNSLWKNASFSTICLTVLLSFSVLQSMEQYSSLFFQEVQKLPAMQASLRILPSLVVGVALNFTTGLFVDKVPALWLVTLSSVLCAGGPLLMAVAKPELPYWYNPFFAQLLQPVSGDVLFTVGLIIVSDGFPEHTQALAGAVFNTASQFGSSLGLAVMQVVSTVTVTNAAASEAPLEALLSGYRNSFWTMFGLMASCAFLGALGLRKTGKVGLKRE